MNRRHFVRGAVFAAAGAMATREAVAQSSAAIVTPPTGKGSIPRKDLGKTGEKVSALGVGGFHLGSAKDQATVSDIRHSRD